ncbi:MAG: DMT family transporter [Leptolyngbyaceae cyanobacterium MO_188.B28]|nr:DMT family transporter [Leptolyngbyaceae cyanobacterium MO_188.B28]
MASGYLLSFAASLCFAGYVVVGKISQNDLEPITLVFYISFLAFFLGLPFALVNKSPLNGRVFKRELCNTGLWLHVICIFFAMWTLWQGVRFLNPATATMLGRTETLWTIFLACLIYKERFSSIYYLAFGLMLLGIMVMNGNPTDFFSMAFLSGGGAVYILLSSLFFAVAETSAKKASEGISPARFTIYRNGIITVIAGMTSLLLGQLQWLEPSQWLNVSIAALLGPGLARLLYLHALKRLELIKTTLICEVEPVLTALMSFLALREIPSFEEWTGGILMLAACLVLILNVYFVEQRKVNYSEGVG